MTEAANVAVTPLAREAAAMAFDARARRAAHPEVNALQRHYAAVIRAGDGDAYDAVQAAAIALRLAHTSPDAGALREAATSLLAHMSSTYRAKNGREIGIEADDGEKCWIIHSDWIEELRRAALAPEPSAAPSPVIATAQRFARIMGAEFVLNDEPSAAPVEEVEPRYAAIGQTTPAHIGPRWYIWKSGYDGNYVGGQIADHGSACAIADELNRLAVLRTPASAVPKAEFLPCGACDKPILPGQVVLLWEDAGEMHADCANPFSLDYERDTDEPEPTILLGSPMRHFRLAALRTPASAVPDVAIRIALWNTLKHRGIADDVAYDIINKTIAAMLTPSHPGSEGGEG